MTMKKTGEVKDPSTGHRFSAKITIDLMPPGTTSRSSGNPYIADILIEPVSGQEIAFIRDGIIHRKAIHYHFILESPTGDGRLVRREASGALINEVKCNVKDLGVKNPLKS